MESFYISITPYIRRNYRMGAFKVPLIRIPYWHYKNLCIEDLRLETSKFVVEGTL